MPFAVVARNGDNSHTAGSLSAGQTLL